MRWVLRLMAVMLAVALLAVGVLFVLPTDRVAQLATREFGRLTGRVLTIEGAVTPTLWPVLGVTTGPVSLSNADWSDAGPMFQAAALTIRLDAAALLSGKVRITGLAATDPVIVLERGRDGRGNWQFGPGSGADAGGAGASAPAATPFTLDHGEITGGTLRFTDKAAGQTLMLTEIAADLTFPAIDGPAQATVQARMNGQTVGLKADISTLVPLLQGHLVPLVLTASAGDAQAAFDGRLGLVPLQAEGKLLANLGNLAALSAVANVPRPVLPEGLGARDIGVSGALTLTAAGAVSLRDGIVRLDGNSLRGEADLTTSGARPKLSARIDSGALSLAAPRDAPAAPGSPKRGWPQTPLDASALGLLDVALAFSADSISLPPIGLGRTRVALTVDRGRAVFDIREIAGYGGKLAGQFVINSRGGLSLGGDLAATGVALQPLLAALAGYQRLIGTGDLALKFLATGTTADALAHSLSGNGRLAFGKGELRGLDLAGMLRTLDPSYVGDGAKTIFDSITASFTLKDGVLANDDLALAAPLVAATGKGRVDIGGQTLDYRIEPTALVRADGSGGVRVPLLITGPWAKPRFALDLAALTGDRLAEEKARLQARLDAERQKAEAAVSNRLGITRAPGESLEDATRRRGREALQSEAVRALNGLLGNGAGN